MVLSTTKKVSSVSSMSNQTSHFGIMGGTASVTGGPSSVRSHKLRKAPTRLVIPVKPAQALAYMTLNKLLSVNPAHSGGIGKRSLIMR
jgi:hypothetical protein